MIKIYFKTALRSLLKHKAFTFINIIGLAIGISAAMVIYLVVQYDFSFDKFQPDGDRIYRVVADMSFQGQSAYNSGVQGVLGPVAQKQVSGVAVVAPFYRYGYDVKVDIPQAKGNAKIIRNQNKIILTDGTYFDLLNFKWLAGSRKQAFKVPYQVVITSNQAKLYFPGMAYASIVGKQLIYEDTLRTTVSGIVEDLKQRTDFTFNDFISLATADADKNLIPDYSKYNWNGTSSSNQLFIKINKNTSTAAIKKQLDALYKRNHEGGFSKTETFEYNLQPLKDLHFDKRYDNFDQRLASKTILYSLLGVAGFLLLLGCINFINLTTAQSAQRAKEIGVRKTIGGTRRQLVGQFLTETFILTLIATLVSALLTYYLLKLFSTFIPQGVNYSMMFTYQMLVFIALLVGVITLVSGLYPAIILSSYQPIQVIKGHGFTSTNKGQYLRKALTVTQFVIAQFFVMGTLLVSSQIKYVLNKDLGFTKDAILFTNTPYKLLATNKQEVFLNKLKEISQISQVSLGSAPPSSGGTRSTTITYKDGKKELQNEVFLKYADENYIPMYKLRLLAGRSLQAHDTSGAFVINQTYVKALGFKNAQSAIGKIVNMNGKNTPIVGVVQDFHQKSLRDPIKPVIVLASKEPWYNGTVQIALKPQHGNDLSWSKAIKQIEQAWKEVYPEFDFEYHFIDDQIAQFYKSEQDTAQLLNWATGLSILISCLGLFGLAIHSTNQRTKEIGVRKVLGASVSQIVTLLNIDFAKLIVVAFVISLPIAWYAMHQWLQNFAYHTTISAWIFVLSICATLMVALLTVSMQTIRSAIANPVKSLRSE
jgi:putative ABC transport system permease protein